MVKLNFQQPLLQSSHDPSKKKYIILFGAQERKICKYISILKKVVLLNIFVDTVTVLFQDTLRNKK